jgi:hypothetical protein
MEHVREGEIPQHDRKPERDSEVILIIFNNSSLSLDLTGVS